MVVLKINDPCISGTCNISWDHSNAPLNPHTKPTSKNKLWVPNSQKKGKIALSNKKDRYIINSVSRALFLIDTFAEHGPMNLLELTELTGLPKSSVYRNLLTLQKHDYVIKTDTTQKFYLGPKLLKITKRLLDNNDLIEKATHDMNLLAKKYNDTVNLGILFNNDEIIYVKIIEGTYSLKMSDALGATLFLHATAIGKSIGAFLPEATVEKIIDKWGLPKLTKNTIIDKQVLFEELAKIRKQGYSVDDEESVIGARCVAAPIFNLQNEVIAAISLSGAIHRFPENKIKQIAENVKETALNISQKLGYYEKGFAVR